MNFRIIEGDTTDWELYESFKDLYFNHLELTLHDIQDRLNLTSSQLNKFRRHTIQETGKQRTRIKEGYKWFDLIGYFYEETVKSSSKASNMGQFFTPPDVCDLMTKLTVKPLKNNGAGEKMYDCAGGSGRLCLSFHSQYPKALCFSHDLDEFSCKMAVLNFLIHGIKGSVCQYNSLTGEFYNGWKINEFPLSIMEINNIQESMIFIGEKTRNTIKLSCPKHSGQTSLGDYI